MIEKKENQQDEGINEFEISSENNNEDKVNTQFVIVTYENILYPGKILEKQGNSFIVSTMTKSGSDWKWPTKVDILSYSSDEIIEYISEPKKKNNRGIYNVPEIEKYKVNRYLI